MKDLDTNVIEDDKVLFYVFALRAHAEAAVTETEGGQASSPPAQAMQVLRAYSENLTRLNLHEYPALQNFPVSKWLFDVSTPAYGPMAIRFAHFAAEDTVISYANKLAIFYFFTQARSKLQNQFPVKELIYVLEQSFPLQEKLRTLQVLAASPFDETPTSMMLRAKNLSKIMTGFMIVAYTAAAEQGFAPYPPTTEITAKWFQRIAEQIIASRKGKYLNYI